MPSLQRVGDDVVEHLDDGAERGVGRGDAGGGLGGEFGGRHLAAPDPGRQGRGIVPGPFVPAHRQGHVARPSGVHGEGRGARGWVKARGKPPEPRLRRAAVASRSARSFIASPAWPRTQLHSTSCGLAASSSAAPQVHVGHRVAGRVAPVAADPAGVPAGDAVAHVFAVGVQHHAARAVSAPPAPRPRRSVPCGCWWWPARRRSAPARCRRSAGSPPSRPGRGWACSRHRSRSPPSAHGRRLRVP